MNPRAASIPHMLAKPLLLVAASLAAACSASDEQPAAGDSIAPAGLVVTPRPGINSVFKVVALTLLSGANGPELYASVKNDGDLVACNASFAVDLHDQDDQVVGSGVSGLMVRRFYRLTDGSGNVAGCVAPGDVTKVAITNLSLDPPSANVRSVVYQSNYWGNLPIEAIDGVSLTGVASVTLGAGVAYTGTLVNGLDMELSNPTVAVFPLNTAGRPLGVAYGGSSVVLPPAGTWAFETSTVTDAGVGFDAYPMGGP
jgi:hypothetical protein